MDCWFVGLLLCTLVLGATRSLGYQPRGGIQDFLVNSGSILGHPGSNFINFGSFFVVCVCVCVFCLGRYSIFLGCWVVVLLGSWILELLGCFVSGLLGCWVVWLSVGCWVVGLLGCWVVGLLGCWVGGLLDC